MEILQWRLSSKPLVLQRATVCGVVGSGNLEVLVKPGSPADCCLFEVKTTAKGFEETWKAVLTEFAAQNNIGGTQVFINDLGATPAVVHLRLTQAFSQINEQGKR